jgi:MFS family permease
MFFTGTVPAIAFFLLLLRAPETPRYLIMAGRKNEARRILAALVDPVSVPLEFTRIQASFAGRDSSREHAQDGRGVKLATQSFAGVPFGLAASSRALCASLNSLLRPGVRRAVTVSFFLAILVHVSGVNTVIDYAPSIFQAAGWKIDAALFATFMVGITNFVFTLASFWLIDRWGRKPLYLLGSVVMAATLAGLAVLSSFDAFHGVLVPLLIMTYLAFFACCIGPVFWTLVPEIFPNHIRGTAMTVPVLTQWVANAFVVLLFPLAFHQLGKTATFGFLALMALLQAVFTWYYVPETNNKTLEEIEEFWVK